jgi:dihydroorotate dehydrogenase
MIYRFLFNTFFKGMDPESAHHLVATGLEAAAKLGVLRAGKRPKPIEVMGLKFENRFGMAAGFDKNARLVTALHALGFGHVEIGTVTPRPQPGNPKPRMFRLTKHDALINRMGFNNDGADVVAVRLAELRKRKNLPVLGVNIGKNKDTPAELAYRDYELATKTLAPYADYLVVNVSSPNTPGLRDLQQVAALRPILTATLENSLGKPVLLKLSPDLADSDLFEILDLVKELGLAGVIAANTTVSRNLEGDANVLSEAGGLSGPILKNRSVEMLKLTKSRLDKSFCVISVGGVVTRADVAERLALGADLVQGYTGFVYQGPLWPRRLAITA